MSGRVVLLIGALVAAVLLPLPASQPSAEAAVGDRVWFAAEDPVHGRELWVSDGTAAGTHMVADIAPGPAYSYPEDLAPTADGVFFTAVGEGSRMVWYSDGTADGTLPVAPLSGGVDFLVAHGDRAFFGADHAGKDQLHTTTSAGPGDHEVIALNGTDEAAPTQGVIIAPYLFVSAIRPGIGREIVRVHTSTFSTADADIESGIHWSWPYDLVRHGSTLAFSAETAAHGRELWTVNVATMAATRQTDIQAGGAGSGVRGLTSVEVDGTPWVYFRADDGSGDDPWRWRAAAGASKVFDVDPVEDSSALRFVSDGSYVYFTAISPAEGKEVYRTDGTPGGTTMITPTRPGPSSSTLNSRLRVIGSRVVFDGYAAAVGSELYEVDGTGHDLLLDAIPGPESSYVYPVGEVDGAVIEVVGRIGTVGRRATDAVWRVDATGTPTLLARTTPSPSPMVSSGGPNADGTLTVAVSTEAGAWELWLVGPDRVPTRRATLPGVVEVLQVRELPGGAVVMIVLDDELGHGVAVVPAGASTHELETATFAPGNFTYLGDGIIDGEAVLRVTEGPDMYVWVSDGTLTGTHRVQGAPPFDLVSPGVVFDDVFVFAGDDGSGQRELWRLKPGAGVGQVDLNGASSSSPADLTVFDGGVFLSALDTGVGREPFVWNGTSLVALGDLYPGGNGSTTTSQGYPTPLPGGGLAFRAMGADGIHQVWVTDGTAAGTEVLSSLPTRVNTILGATADHVIVLANSEIVAIDLTTGTDTSLLETSSRGSGAGAYVDGELWFQAYVEGHGSELYRTDGTPAGTVLAAELVPGPASSSPGGLMAGSLWFTASRGAPGSLDVYGWGEPGVGTPQPLLPPYALDDTATVPVGGAVTIDVLDDDVTLTGSSLDLVSVSGATLGTAVIDGDAITYTADGSAAGVDVLTYEVADAHDPARWSTATVTVTIRGEDPIPGDPQVRRIQGDNRVLTAIEVSQEAFDGGADTVVLARADSYPDALAGAPLATHLGAPILLTPRDRLHDDVAAEINRLGASRAVLLGGEGALSSDVAAALDAMPAITDVDRFGGSDRFATAALVAAELPPTTSAYVAEGADADPRRGWPDALSVSALASAQARPILLVTTDRLPDATATALTDLGITDATVIGGEGAVDATVFGAVDDLVADVERVFGPDRYSTSRAVADRAAAAGGSPAFTWLATGGNFPDALVAAPAVARLGGTFLLVSGSDLERSAATREWLVDHLDDPIELVRLLGGVGAISAEVEQQIRTVLGI